MMERIRRVLLWYSDGKNSVTPDLTHDSASVSKVVELGLCIFYLQSGKLDLDEKLSTHYPEKAADKTLTFVSFLLIVAELDPYSKSMN